MWILYFKLTNKKPIEGADRRTDEGYVRFRNVALFVSPSLTNSGTWRNVIEVE